MNDTNGDPFGANAAETARLVREVQDLGFDAARTIVDRFAALFSQFAAGTGGDVDDAPRLGRGGEDTPGRRWNGDDPPRPGWGGDDAPERG